MKLAFLDTETTGLNPNDHEVIEIAIIVEEEGKEDRAFHSLILPERLARAQPEALRINGYASAPERWEAAPRMAEVGAEIETLLKGAILVGHNVGFDASMLDSSMRRVGLDPRLPYHRIDTVTLAHEHLRPLGLQKLSLDSIRDFLLWSREGAHTAMKDAQDARRLYHLLLRANPLLLRGRISLARIFGAEV